MYGNDPFHDTEDRLLIVVRHGDAGVKGGCDGPDLLRPLSLAGYRQAEGLVIQLEDYPVERIVSSPAVRCRETVQPLAHDRMLEVEAAAALGVDAGPAQVRALLEDQGLRNAVLCTHGETIGQLFIQLAVASLERSGPLQWPKGSTWLLQRTRLRVHARYLPPLAVDPAPAS